MWTLWVALAIAWEHDAPTVIALDAPARDVAVAGTISEPMLVVLSDGQLDLQRGHERIARTPTTANAIAAHDLDRDGFRDLLLCGPEGVELLPFIGGTIGAPRPLLDEPCTALAVRPDDDGGWSSIVVANAEATYVLQPDSNGVLQTNRYALTVSGTPVLATGPDRILLGAKGSADLHVHDIDGGGIQALGAPLLAVASGLDPAWAIDSEPPVVQWGQRRLDLSRPPVGIAIIALDDGPMEVFAWDDEGWLAPDLDLDLPPGHPTAADVDGDGCSDLLIRTTELLWARGLCPEPAPPPVVVSLDTGAGDPEVVDTGGQAGAATADPVDTGDDSGVAPPVDDDEGTSAPEEDPAPEDDVPEDDDDAPPWPPPAWIEGRRLRDEELPAPPSSLTLGGTWPHVQVFVDAPARIALEVPQGRADQLSKGPPSAILEDGHLVYTAQPDEIGSYAVSVRYSPGRWTGLHIHVWPRPRPGEALPKTFRAPPSPGEPSDASAEPAAIPSWARLGRCAVGAGVVFGASRSGGLVWEDLGNPAVVPSGSPAVAVTCPGGGDGLIQWSVGLDSAPLFRYTDVPTDRSHLLGATVGLSLGSPEFRVGPYASAGVTAVNLGGRLQGWFSDRYGIEARVGWLAPRAGVESMLLVSRRLGRRAHVPNEKAPASER